MRHLQLLTLLLLLSGCSLLPKGSIAEIKPGVYNPLASSANDVETPWRTIADVNSLFVDRQHQVVWIFYNDASLTIDTYDPRSEHNWPEGCQTNLSATPLEVFDLGLHELTIRTETVLNPILVGNCPSDLRQLVLRDNGDISIGGSACTGARSCLVLEWTSKTLEFPQSMKGYELYSWQADGDQDWTYTLITGTNREKTWEEVSSPTNTITEGEWIKITVHGEAAFHSVLDRLAEGESILWWKLSTNSGQEDLVSFPDEGILHEIVTYSQQHKLNLSLSSR